MPCLFNAGFDSVSAADTADLTFSREVVDLLLSADHCVVIRTALSQIAVYPVFSFRKSLFLQCF